MINPGDNMQALQTTLVSLQYMPYPVQAQKTKIILRLIYKNVDIKTKLPHYIEENKGATS